MCEGIPQHDTAKKDAGNVNGAGRPLLLLRQNRFASHDGVQRSFWRLAHKQSHHRRRRSGIAVSPFLPPSDRRTCDLKPVHLQIAFFKRSRMPLQGFSRERKNNETRVIGWNVGVPAACGSESCKAGEILFFRWCGRV